jgi:hypothetical protein
MLSLKRLRAPIGIAALLILASSVPGAAQIWYPAYPMRFAPPDASVKFDVKPNNAAVYVDGYFAGIVDDFDGPFQRLYTEPGGHEITLFLDGYRTYTLRAYLAPNRTFKIAHQMEKLPAGEVAERPPTPAAPPPDEEPAAPGRPQSPFGRRGPATRRAPLPPPNAPPPAERGSTERRSAGGTLELNVQPADAEVLVDGRPWRGTGQERLTIDLSEGRHNIQIRKQGYVGYLTDVEIRNGETISLNVNLRTQPPR